ncbi:hypothetical protein GCM10011617_15270 [Novosphingobium arvoryzae]|uniref:Uncharacterized protein n=1 Tax=Novosphingobium arvoryzae TaxID=1256514 RepID=A0A918VEW7_9SPHN|nr:hypothetical protein GCM10011617_15270 [Novosphingobium arvoryzae]
MPLQIDPRRAEIVAIAVGRGVKVQVAHRRHRHVAGLERQPAPPPDPHRSGFQRGAEYRPDQRGLAIGQRAFAPGRAIRIRLDQ